MILEMDSKPPTGGTGDSEYPVRLDLDGIEVINSGINHIVAY